MLHLPISDTDWLVERVRLISMWLIWPVAAEDFNIIWENILRISKKEKWCLSWHDAPLQQIALCTLMFCWWGFITFRWLSRPVGSPAVLSENTAVYLFMLQFCFCLSCTKLAFSSSSTHVLIFYQESFSLLLSKMHPHKGSCINYQVLLWRFAVCNNCVPVACRQHLNTTEMSHSNKTLLFSLSFK